MKRAKLFIEQAYLFSPFGFEAPSENHQRMTYHGHPLVC
jgi:hypothetical protein